MTATSPTSHHDFRNGVPEIHFKLHCTLQTPSNCHKRSGFSATIYISFRSPDTTGHRSLGSIIKLSEDQPKDRRHSRPKTEPLPKVSTAKYTVFVAPLIFFCGACLKQATNLQRHTEENPTHHQPHPTTPTLSPSQTMQTIQSRPKTDSLPKVSTVDIVLWCMFEATNLQRHTEKNPTHPQPHPTTPTLSPSQTMHTIESGFRGCPCKYHVLNV